MKEKMLVLGIADPRVSRKYEASVCVAGITNHGQMRRIYSIPLRYYYLNPFKKFQYVEYELLDKKSDIRPESRKIDPTSIELLQMASPATIAQKLRENQSSSLDYLRQRRKLSLGIVRPDIESFQVEYRDYPRTARYSAARSGKRALNLLPYWIKFHFRCRPSCPSHSVLCQDMEIGNYYRRTLHRIHGLETAKKTIERMHNFLDEITPYFLMGTHHRYKCWLIISIVNPQARHFYNGVCLE